MIGSENKERIKERVGESRSESKRVTVEERRRESSERGQSLRKGQPQRK